jgi:hypothetical protein
MNKDTLNLQLPEITQPRHARHGAIRRSSASEAQRQPSEK